MLNVFITVDTEFWTTGLDRHPAAVRAAVRRDIHGQTNAGKYGVEYQIDVLSRHGLKGVFLVEALAADAVGPEYLRDTIATVQGAGHEVQLHLHTEWLRVIDSSPLPGRTGGNMKDFSEVEQRQLIARGLHNLRECGAERVTAFRAGNYGASLATLPALARNGLRFDTSHNTCYLDSTCAMPTPDTLLQPCELGGLWEYPISFFSDGLGGRRHAQLCACSSAEMERALLQAWREGWDSFVIVSHSFELIARRNDPPYSARPNRIVIARFNRLCRFLSQNADKFRAVGFNDISPDAASLRQPILPLRSHALLTAARMAEQLVSRWI